MSLRQLSALDATFLFIETPEMPMHVGAVHLLELPDGYRGRYVADLRRHLASRLPAAPALRRRLWSMPLNLASPAWVEAEPDLDAHVVEIRLTREQARGRDALALMEEQVARLHPVLLDRRRPLWKFHVVEGLPPSPAGRRQVGLYSQLHHAAVDGQAAVALANVIFDVVPQPPALAARPSRRARAFRLDMVEMLRGALANEAAQVARIVRELPATAGTLAVAARTALLRTVRGAGPANVTFAPETPLNVSVGTARAFAGLTLPLRELQQLARAHGATLNEVVLMLCATALRWHLGKRRCLPRKSLVAAVPVSLREQGDGESDNQASMSLVSLGTHIADPRRRLQHVMAASRSMKQSLGTVRDILPTDFPSIGLPWLMEAAASLYGKAKIAERIPRVANLVISNVPGPQRPLYLAGARMMTNYPTSIVVHGLALNITVHSYDQSLDFGLMADPQALPQVRDLAAALGVALDELRALPLPLPRAAGGEEAGEDTGGDGGGAVGRMGRAALSLTGRVGDAVGGMVSNAVQGVIEDGVAGSLGKVARAVRPRRSGGERRR